MDSPFAGFTLMLRAGQMPSYGHTIGMTPGHFPWELHDSRRNSQSVPGRRYPAAFDGRGATRRGRRSRQTRRLPVARRSVHRYRLRNVPFSSSSKARLNSPRLFITIEQYEGDRFAERFPEHREKPHTVGSRPNFNFVPWSNTTRERFDASAGGAVSGQAIHSVGPASNPTRWREM